MAIERVRVGSYDNEAVIMEYDLDTATGKATTLYYKNSLNMPVYLVLRATDGTELFRHELPSFTNTLVTRNIPAGNRPTVEGLGISLDAGVFGRAR